MGVALHTGLVGIAMHSEVVVRSEERCGIGFGRNVLLWVDTQYVVLGEVQHEAVGCGQRMGLVMEAVAHE